MLRYIFSLVIAGLVLSLGVSSLEAAVGCSLNDPDRDVRRIFPQATNYKTEFITIKERGGSLLLEEVEKKLGQKLDPIYESLDVPYAYYTVLKGKETIGYVHGVNQKGTYGGMQIILATDLKGEIVDFYYQKLSSPEARKFRDKDFRKQLIGLSLADFYHQTENLIGIKNPSQNQEADFKATLRGIKKNLILLDEFILDNKYDSEFEKIKGGKK